MNIVQFMWHEQQWIGDILPNRRIRLFNRPCSLLDVVKRALKKEQALNQYIFERLSNAYLNMVDIASPSFAFKAVSHDAPMSTWIGGAGFEYKNSTITRKHAKHQKERKEALSALEEIYTAGTHDDKQQLSRESARPECFFKRHAGHIITSSEVISMSAHDSSHEEAKLVAMYYVDEDKHIHRLGFCLGYAYFGHTLAREYRGHQRKFISFAVGAEIMMDELPSSIKLTSCICRDEHLFEHADIATDRENRIHRYDNIESHVFCHTQLMMPDSIYYHFMDTSPMSYIDDIGMKDKDIVKIKSDHFKFPLVNQIHMH